MEFSPLYYGMLNPYESNILSRRPLQRGEVYKLWKSTLARFLVGNGKQCDHRAVKNVLVDMVINLVEDEQPDDGHQHSVIIPVNETWQGSDDNLMASYVTATASFSISSSPSNAYQEQAEPTAPCNCHECQNTEPPVPLPYHMVESECMPTCQAQLNFGDYIDEDEVYPNSTDNTECICSISVDQLLRNVNLSSDSVHTFQSMSEKPTKDLVEFLQNFGLEMVHVSGCRVHLLMLLRDLLDEQGRVYDIGSRHTAPITTITAASTSGASGGLAEGVTLSSRDFSPEKIMKEEAEEQKTSPADSSQQEHMRECCICLQNPREIAFVPCGHALCCRTCARKLRECPVCRKRVHRRLKLFFS